MIILCCLSGCGADKTQQAFSLKKNEDELPSYYASYMEAKVEQIKYNEENNDIALSFAFLTDLHWDCSAKNSPMLLKYICDNTNVNKTVLGGDYISTDYDDTEYPLSVMREVSEKFSFCDNYAILGNHDTNSNNGWGKPEIKYSDSMNALSNGTRTKSYYTEAEGNIRYLFLDTNDFAEDGEQYEWLQSQLLSFNENNTVFIFLHEYFRESGETFVENSNGNVLNKLLADNADKLKCTVAGIFTGHIHNDFMKTNDSGFKVVVTTCDGVDVKVDSEPYFRKRGTITEHAFDIVQVDLNHRKVFLTRIGAGNDRTYEY